MPPEVGFYLVFIGLGVGVLNSFLPGGGEFAHQKIARDFAVRLEILSKVITKKNKQETCEPYVA